MSELSQRVMTRVGRAALRKARVAIPSKTLKQACSFVPEQGGSAISPESRGRLTIPHYWARIVHTGRKGFSVDNEQRPTKILIWYKNPADDPRLQGGHTPARYADRGRFTRLTRERFRQDKKAGKLIIAKKVGPVAANPFFGNEPGQGMHGLMQEAHLIAREQIRKEMASFIGVEEGKAAVASL